MKYPKKFLKENLPESAVNFLINIRARIKSFVFNKTLVYIMERNGVDRPNSLQLRLLSFGWNNPGWSAKMEYLEILEDLATNANGYILECGSGLSTVLLALWLRGSGNTLISLENNPQWRARINLILNRYNLNHVLVVDAPLVGYGEYSWYSVRNLGDVGSGIALVVCDGPPETTEGGRFGLVPVMNKKFKPGCKIFLDDAFRKNEQHVLKLWKEQFDYSYQPCGLENQYAIVEVSTPN